MRTKGNPLNYASVQYMLNNRRYIGKYKYRDIIDPDRIPQDLFDRVQEKVERRSQVQRTGCFGECHC